MQLTSTNSDALIQAKPIKEEHRKQLHTYLTLSEAAFDEVPLCTPVILSWWDIWYPKDFHVERAYALYNAYYAGDSSLKRLFQKSYDKMVSSLITAQQRLAGTNAAPLLSWGARQSALQLKDAALSLFNSEREFLPDQVNMMRLQSDTKSKRPFFFKRQQSTLHASQTIYHNASVTNSFSRFDAEDMHLSLIHI